MAILDIFNAGQEDAQDLLRTNPQTLSILAQLAQNAGNGVNQGATQGSATQAPESATQQPVEQSQQVASAPVQQSQQDQQAQPQATQAQGQEESSSGLLDMIKNYAGKALSGLAQVGKDPQVLDSLRAFGSAMSNDKQGYENAMNSYTQRLDQNAQQKAKQQQDLAKAQREQQARAQQAYIENLYKYYTPQSVEDYRNSGDRGMLVENQATVNARNKDAREGLDLQLKERKTNSDIATSSGNLQVTQERLNDARTMYQAAKSVTLPNGVVVDKPGHYKMEDGSYVDVASGPNGLTAGVSKLNDPMGKSSMVYKDPDGKTYTVATNSRGTPLVDNKSGVATVYDEDGNITQRSINPVKMEATAIQANESLQQIQDLQQSGALGMTGGYHIEASLGNAVGMSTLTNLKNNLDTINESIKGQVLAQLLVENGGHQVTDKQLEAEEGRIGKLDVNASPEQNQKVLDRMIAFLNRSLNQGMAGERNPTVATTNYASPTTATPRMDPQGGAVIYADPSQPAQYSGPKIVSIKRIN